MSNRNSIFPIPKNELYYWNDNEGVLKPLATPNGSIPVTGVQQKILDAFETIDTNLWDYTTGTGDIVTTGGNTAGSGYVKISKSLVDEGQETVFTSKFIIKPAFRFALGMSLSQRIAHQRFSLELIGVDADGNEIATVAVPTPLTVSSLSQSTTTLTVNTSTPHGFVPADRIVLWGHADSRFNYGECYVDSVSSPTQFTVITTMTGSIPSVTATPTGTSMVSKVEPFSYGDNVMGIVWEGNSSTNARLLTRTQKSVLFESGQTGLGSGHTDATVSNSKGFADAFNPKYLYDVRFKSEGLVIRTMPVDSTNGTGGQLKRTQVVPDVTEGYKIRLRARNNVGMSKPVAKIVNASKSGSTTATITTAQPHGLTTSDQIMIYGNRDQTNFANLTTATAVASVVDANTFTIAFGASATASARGGVVVKVNGSYGIAVAGQSAVSISASSGLMTVTGSANWTGFAIGETVELYGLVDSGANTVYTQYEGVYQVANISTTALTLYAPNVADFATIQTGGAVIKRTDLRLHLLRVLDYTRQTVEIDGTTGNYADYQEAMGVNILNGLTVSTGQSAHDSVIAGNPVRMAGRARTSNVTAVANDDTHDFITTAVGALVTKQYSIPELDWSYAGTAVTGTTDVALKGATASIRNYMTGLQIHNTHATVATEVVIKDGATVIWRGYAPANMSVPIVINFDSPLKTTAGNALNFACITTGANVYVNAQGYQAV